MSDWLPILIFPACALLAVVVIALVQKGKGGAAGALKVLKKGWLHERRETGENKAAKVRQVPLPRGRLKVKLCTERVFRLDTAEKTRSSRLSG